MEHDITHKEFLKDVTNDREASKCQYESRKNVGSVTEGESSR